MPATVSEKSGRDTFRNDCTDANAESNPYGVKYSQFPVDIECRHFHGASATHLIEGHYGPVNRTVLVRN